MGPRSTIKLHTGNSMPVIGLGTWQLSQETPTAIQHALRLGYRMIDTSGDYGTQAGIGEGIKRSGMTRDKLYIVTKVEETDEAYQAVRRNLKELQMDFADLILIHRPPLSGAGEELWAGLIRAKKDSLAKDIGVSNYSIKQIQRLAEVSGELPTVNQIEWSPFGHSEEMFQFCTDNGIIIQAYSPLTRTKKLKDDTLEELTAAYNKTAAQILLRWNIQLGVVPLPKASNYEHMEENLDVFEFKLSDDDMATLNGLNEHYSSLGALQYL